MLQPLIFGRTNGLYQSEGCDLQRSKETVVLAEEQVVSSGRILGKVSAAVLAVGAVTFSGTGNGVFTPATPGPGAPAGSYKIRCIEKTADSGLFEALNPDGSVDGFFTVGVPKTTGNMRGTIADGAVDYDQTSEFTAPLTRTAAAGDGQVKAWSPTATDGSQIAFGVNYAATTTDEDETFEIVAHVRDCRVWKIYLDFGTATDTQIAKAIAELADKGLIVA